MEKINIPCSKIRLYLDTLGMNKDLQDVILDIDNKILSLKKQGMLDRPEPVKVNNFKVYDKTLKKRVFISNSHEKEYQAALTEYSNKLVKWEKYVSKEYMVTKSAYKCVKLLEEVQLLLQINTENTKSKATELLTFLQKYKPIDLIITKNIKESVEEFEVRKKSTEWHPQTFSYFIKEAITVTSIGKIISSIKAQYTDIELFISKYKYSKSKERFNKDGIKVIAELASGIITELVSSSITNARYEGSRKVLPEYIVSDDSKSLYHFYKNLPQYKIIQERNLRKKQYEKECIELKNIELKKKIDDYKAQGKIFNYNKDMPNFSNIKAFKDKELFEGFAVVKTTETQSQQSRSKYLWKNIDFWEETNKRSFVIYIKKHFDTILQDYEIDLSKMDNQALSVPPSTIIIINNIIVEFLKYLLPRLESLKQLFNDKKTTDCKMVLFIIKMILMQDNVSKLEDNQLFIYNKLKEVLDK